MTEEEDDEEYFKKEEDALAGSGGTRLLAQPSCELSLLRIGSCFYKAGRFQS